MEAVDDEVAGDGAQEENTVSVGDGAAGEDAQEEEVDELQESGNEEASRLLENPPSRLRVHSSVLFALEYVET